MQRDEALRTLRGMAEYHSEPRHKAARWALDEIARLELLTAPGVIEGITKSLEDIKAGRGVALEDIDRIAELEGRIVEKDAALGDIWFHLEGIRIHWRGNFDQTLEHIKLIQEKALKAKEGRAK